MQLLPMVILYDPPHPHHMIYRDICIDQWEANGNDDDDDDIT